MAKSGLFTDPSYWPRNPVKSRLKKQYARLDGGRVASTGVKQEFKKHGLPKQLSEVRVRDCARQAEYGLVTYRGFTWMGTIKKVFMEVWKLDPNTRLARLSGDRVDLLHPDLSQIRFRLEDFLRLGTTDSRLVTLDLGEFRHLLKRMIMELAVDRCRNVLRGHKKFMEGPADKDYEPSEDSQMD